MVNANDLQTAIEHLKNDELTEADDICVGVLETSPDNAKAWHLRGIIHAQQANLSDAASCFAHATECDNENAMYFYNLGLAYAQMDEMEKAIESYRNAIERRADFLEARNNLGNALLDSGNAEEALDCFRDLANDHADSSDCQFNMANVLQKMGRVDECIETYRRAIELDPENSDARENLGKTFADAGREDEARQVWATWLEYEPDNVVARHMHASMSGEDVPQRCEDEFVRETFHKSFAKQFDDQMTQLQYQAPELIAEAFESNGDKRTELDVLDAGCGTGLCGPIFRDKARHFVGVDLSEDMLLEADRRETYDETLAAELTEYMSAQQSSFDLIISADTFCYFGDLNNLASASCRCLRRDGLLIFTVELAEAEGDDYVLQQNGRYRHREDYVSSALHNAGFVIRESRQATLRHEGGRPVEGLVVSAAVRGE